MPESESGELFEAIAELPENISVLFIEHDMNLVFRFSRRISVLVAGRILTEGTPAQISADPLVREVYLGPRNRGRGSLSSDPHPAPRECRPHGSPSWLKPSPSTI